MSVGDGCLAFSRLKILTAPFDIGKMPCIVSELSLPTPDAGTLPPQYDALVLSMHYKSYFYTFSTSVIDIFSGTKQGAG